MIGGVAVREAPDSNFYVLPANGSNATAILDVAARDARRVQVAVVLTTLVGIIQVRTNTQHTQHTQLACENAADLICLPKESLLFAQNFTL